MNTPVNVLQSRKNELFHPREEMTSAQMAAAEYQMNVAWQIVPVSVDTSETSLA